MLGFGIVVASLGAPASDWRAALNWASTPGDAQLQLLILLCTAAALGGLIERRRRSSGPRSDASPPRGTPH